MTKHHKQSHHKKFPLLYAAATYENHQYSHSNQPHNIFYHNDHDPAHQTKKNIKHAKKELEHELKHNCCTIV